jgi:N-succinyldiaminopimelate aminotransferase
MPTYSNRVSGFGTTIFTEINNLAMQHNAINLGQGTPDFNPQQDIIDAMVKALQSGVKVNQYAPGPGVLAAREAVANHASKFYNLNVDPKNGVLMTPGATVAVFESIMGLVDPGDEVVIIEPFFDSYVPGVLMAGAKPVFVPLHPPTWTFDPDELRAAFNDKTRTIIINTPHNPTGRVFTIEELSLIAELCQKYDVTVISDEVYEHLTFDNVPHIPIATLPGMFERTVTIGSLGKSFSVTGWKTGWVYGPNELIKGVWQGHQFIVFTGSNPHQNAAAYALSLPGEYFEDFQTMYTTKRDIIMQGLTAAGLKSRTPEGTYFAMADFSDVFDGDDIEFARYITQEIGVACIPPTFFYSEPHKHIARKQARFAFCKNDDTLREAGERLARLRG